jgi:hypothetical protein
MKRTLTEPFEEAARKPTSERMTRRNFLPSMIIAMTGLGFVFARFLKGKEYSEGDSRGLHPQPHFRKRRKDTGTPPKLEPGFYINSKSQIIHYLPEGKRFHYTGHLKETNLNPYEPSGMPVNEAKPRINLSRFSYSVEQAAVSRLKGKNIDGGCDLLLSAITYELLAQYPNDRRLRSRPFKQKPSLRLYDLLAGASVRFDRPDYLERMIGVIESTKNITVNGIFHERLQKWRDLQSPWHRRWGNKSKKIEWKVDQFSGLVLLM